MRAALCLCLVLIGLWRGGAPATLGDTAAPTALTVWRNQTGSRAALHALPAQFWPASCRAALLHGLWPAPTPRYGFAALLPGRPRAAAIARLRQWSATPRFH